MKFASACRHGAFPPPVLGRRVLALFLGRVGEISLRGETLLVGLMQNAFSAFFLRLRLNIPQSIAALLKQKVARRLKSRPGPYPRSKRGPILTQGDLNPVLEIPPASRVPSELEQRAQRALEMLPDDWNEEHRQEVLRCYDLLSGRLDFLDNRCQVVTGEPESLAEAEEAGRIIGLRCKLNDRIGRLRRLLNAP